MAIDTDRLVQIAHELKSLDERRQKLLAELQRIAGGIGGSAPAARRRGRPPGSRNQAKPALAPIKPVAPAPGRKRRKGLANDLVEFLKSSGGAHTAGELVIALNRPKTKGQSASISTTLGRLRREGRVKKDKERGYRAA